MPAFCDMVWPALYFEEIGILTWWVIALGLILEFPFYYFINKNLKKSILTNLISNIISAVAGIIMIPLFGILWEVFPGSIMYKFFNIGTFNPITYVATFFIAVFTNVLLESIALNTIFKIKYSKQMFILLSIANLISVTIALIPIFNKYGNVFKKL